METYLILICLYMLSVATSLIVFDRYHEFVVDPNNMIKWVMSLLPIINWYAIGFNAYYIIKWSKEDASND